MYQVRSYICSVVDQLNCGENAERRAIFGLLMQRGLVACVSKDDSFIHYNTFREAENVYYRGPHMLEISYLWGGGAAGSPAGAEDIFHGMKYL